MQPRNLHFGKNGHIAKARQRPILAQLARRAQAPTPFAQRFFTKDEVCALFNVPYWLAFGTKPRQWGNPERFSK